MNMFSLIPTPAEIKVVDDCSGCWGCEGCTGCTGEQKPPCLPPVG